MNQCECIVQSANKKKFYPPKIKNKKGKKEKRKEGNTKWRKKQKVGWGVEISNFVQHASFPFSLPFSSYFAKTEFWWVLKENSQASVFSPHPPPNQTSFPPIFSPIFYSLFFSILPKIHPTKVKRIYSKIFNPQDCFLIFSHYFIFFKSFTFHNFSFFK